MSKREAVERTRLWLQLEDNGRFLQKRSNGQDMDEQQQDLLQRVIDLWRLKVVTLEDVSCVCH